MVPIPVYAVFGHVFYAVIGVSVVSGLSVVWLTTTRFTDHWLKVLWIGIAFAVSKAFAEYSTSGLENTLTHFLLVLFLCVYFLAPQSSRRLFFLSLLAGILCLNRLDCMTMIAPAVAYEVWRGGLRPSWRPLVYGLTPLTAWSLFSTFYYGTPLPNTAYAKLGTGISRAAYGTVNSILAFAISSKFRNHSPSSFESTSDYTTEIAWDQLIGRSENL
jgi:arabinofuranosyltransferase